MADEKGIQQSGDSRFEFHYSAGEQRKRTIEIERIRNQYTVSGETKQETLARPQQKDQLEELKKLDEKAKQPALIVSLSLGVGGTLILGLGLSMCLAMDLMAGGILVGVLGMIVLSMAFPVNQYLLKKGKEKYGARILELSQELLETE